jgi:transcriptional regulator with XRE-family HTH domain
MPAGLLVEGDERSPTALPSSQTARTRRQDALIGARLRKRRRDLGLTQAELAKALAISFTQVQRYEDGSNRIAAGRLAELASVLQVPITYFFPEAPSAEVSEDIARSPGATQVLRAYASIKCPDTRRAVLQLTRSLAATAARKRMESAQQANC